MTTQEELGLIDRFRAQAREFWRQWQALSAKEKDIAKYPPELQAEYRKVIDKGSTIRSLIENATRAVDSIASIIARAKAILGLGELGVLPLIPAAVIGVVTASLAAIGAWTVDAIKLQKKLDAAESLVARGVDPVQAYSIVGQATAESPTWKSTLTTLAILAVAGIALWKLAPVFTKRG